MALINEEMRKKKSGFTLVEKIEHNLNKIKEKNCIQLIDDCFLKNEIENGAKFSVRRTNLLRGDRARDIEDEILVA